MTYFAETRQRNVLFFFKKTGPGSPRLREILFDSARIFSKMRVLDLMMKKKTPLFSLHEEYKARLVPFGGYVMPLQYPEGILSEHRHTRDQASLFDVSHMGQVRLRGAGAIEAFEGLIPGDVARLSRGRLLYTLLTTPEGTIMDDLMITHEGETLFLVLNAALKTQVTDYLRSELPPAVEVVSLEDRGLLALQGPQAAQILQRHLPQIETLKFLHSLDASLQGTEVSISRSGYTGEDGFELSIKTDAIEDVARLLLKEPETRLAGLGARDTLRLEAGLCLSGQDIDPTTTPIEAGLSWTIGKRRRNERNFPGADIILDQLERGAARKRVGLRLESKLVGRRGSPIADGRQTIGTITSGSFSPSLGQPIAMGYIQSDYPSSQAAVLIRDAPIPAQISPLPFVRPRYYRG